MQFKIEQYELVDAQSNRPKAERILFCDGTGGRLFRVETDLELSHWRPNTTPAEYRAGTSTEICYRFLDHPREGNWTVAVNNHVDVDGILSVYVLVHSEHALSHRKIIVEAAEMGDFWGWGESASQRLCQGITRLMERDAKPKQIYAEAFARIPSLIDGTDREISKIDDSLLALQKACELIDQNQIKRHKLGPRLTHYVIPLEIAGSDDHRLVYVAEFNEAISTKMLLWPQARARSDAEKFCLISSERPAGWFHDLYFPGYLWADTEGKWLVPGLTFTGGMSSYRLDYPPLVEAVKNLQNQESAVGIWSLGGSELPFGDEIQKQFPLAMRFFDSEGETAVSQLTADIVGEIILGIL